MSDLQHHLHSQREAALRLIFQHNQILSRAVAVETGAVDSAPLAAPSPVPAATSVQAPGITESVPAAPSPAPTAGKVISLFDYKETATEDASTASTDAINCHVFSENDDEAMSTWKQRVDQLLAEYGGDDALAINRKQMADTIFLVEDPDALFYHKSVDGVMFVTCYVGPDERYDSALADIVAYAEQNELVINIMSQEDRVDSLTAAGLSTTPIGIWQRVEPVEEFTTAGSKMRRLRYLVSKYTKLGDVRTEEYIPGTTPDTDKAVCDVMDAWVELKKANPPFVTQVQKQVMAGDIASDHRFFLTWRENKLENVIVLSRDNKNDGYLMDLEFYAEGLPLGSTEFALCQIIETFKQEGRKVLSLGLTMGTGLFEHDNQSPEVYELFQSLKKAEYLDGDANAQYKNKYRPKSVAMFIARPQGCGRKKLNDLMMILGTG